MKNWSDAVKDAVLSGSVASAMSTAGLALLSRREAGSAFAATNAISHWLWGDSAFQATQPDLSHTALGYGIHHASSTLWSVVFEKLFGDRASQGHAAQALAGGLAVAGLACFVDYKLTPKRLQPGIERHLSTGSMAVFYGLFGVALAVTGVARARRGFNPRADA